MTAAPTVPYDATLEETVIASCIGHPKAWRSAASVVGASDFYSPVRGELFDACRLLDGIDPWPACGVSWRTVRFAAVATIATHLPRSCETAEDLARWVAERSTFIHGGERWARDVGSLAQRRRVMSITAEAYNLIGTGADLATVRPLLEQLAAMEVPT